MNFQITQWNNPGNIWETNLDDVAITQENEQTKQRQAPTIPFEEAPDADTYFVKSYCKNAETGTQKRIAADFINDPNIVLNYKNNHQSNLLHIAAFNGDYELARALLINGINVHQTNDEGETPLHSCCKSLSNNAPELFELLIKNGGDITLKDKYGHTTQDIIRARSFKDKIYTDLLRLNQEAEDQGKESTEYAKTYSAFMIKIDSLPHIKSFAKSCPENWKFLADSLLEDHHGTIKKLDEQKNNYLHLAVHSGAIEVAKVLLKCGIDVNGKNAYGQTPLHICCMNISEISPSIFKLFLQNHADITIKDSSEKTCFDYILSQPKNANYHKMLSFYFDRAEQLASRKNGTTLT
jgi:ankyrin repeat protein